MMALMTANPPGVRRRPTSVRVVARVLGVTAMALTLAGCPGHEPDPPPDNTDAALEIRLNRSAKRLGPEAEAQLQSSVGQILSTYVVDGFLGDYPRDDFVDVLEVFTSRGAQKAARDLDLLTAARVGSADDVVARRLLAWISAAEVDDEAFGLSAHVTFEFDVMEGTERAGGLALSGRLMLTPDGDSWRIFGYKVRLDDAASSNGAGS